MIPLGRSGGKNGVIEVIGQLNAVFGRALSCRDHFTAEYFMHQLMGSGSCWGRLQHYKFNLLCAGFVVKKFRVLDFIWFRGVDLKRVDAVHWIGNSSCRSDFFFFFFFSCRSDVFFVNMVNMVLHFYVSFQIRHFFKGNQCLSYIYTVSIVAADVPTMQGFSASEGIVLI